MAEAALDKNGDTRDTPELDPYVNKILVVGESKCGKSTLIRTFAKDNFSAELFQDTGATVYPYEHYYFGQLREFAFVEIPDVPESDINRVIHNHMYAKACIFMFAIDDPPSHQQLIDKWIPALEHLISEAEIPSIVVGFKKDLRENPHIINLLALGNLTPVTYAEGQSLTANPIIEKYFELSQNDLQGITEMIAFILNLAFTAANI